MIQYIHKYYQNKEGVTMDRPNVLIVDDDMQAVNTMCLFLSEISNAFGVSSGRQAIEYVQQFPVDVILLDIDMPFMNGFQTLEYLRNLKECINVPVILVSGKHDKATVANSVLLGVDGYLIKPVDKETLQKKVMEVYQKKTQVINHKIVLAIDDDITYLKHIENLLHASYNVVMINSAKLALNYLIKHIPDVILLDYQMPLYNGASLINMIRQNAACHETPVIILSGTLDKHALKECYPFHPFACLAKPVTKETLTETIERALNQ